MERGAVIVAGFGFRKRAVPATFAAMLGGHKVTHLAVLAEKADHAGFRAFAAQSGVPVIEVADVAGIETAAQSTRIAARFGTGSVCEAVALATLKRACLAMERQVSDDGTVTMAIAKGSI